MGDKNIDLGFKDELDDDKGSDNEGDSWEQFKQRERAKDDKKKLEMTTALTSARENLETTMMNPNQSRMDRTVSIA